MFDLSASNLKPPLGDLRREIWHLFETGQLDEDQATVRLLRADIAMRRAGAEPHVQTDVPSAFLFG